MKNISLMKKAYLLIFGILAIQAHAQCGITIPKVDAADGRGGKMCLEGSPSSTYDICLENLAGNLNFLYNGTKRFSFLNSGMLGIGYDATDMPLADLHVKNSIALGKAGAISGLRIDQVDAAKSETYFKNGRENNYTAFTRTISSVEKSIFGIDAVSTGNLLYLYDENTNTPEVQLSANDGSNSFIKNNNFGIGTITPGEKLDVAGNGAFGKADDVANYKIVLRGSTNGNTPDSKIYYPTRYRSLSFEFGSTSSSIQSFKGAGADTYLQFLTHPVSTSESAKIRMQINQDGKVIIGSEQNIVTLTSNEYKLFVETGIITEKLKIAIRTTSLWQDHVFLPEYQLAPLAEVEKYIKANHHLPGIPSDKELVRDGLDVAGMQAMQMGKIEEITLYLIEMKKEIEALKHENDALKATVTDLKKNR